MGGSLIENMIALALCFAAFAQGENRTDFSILPDDDSTSYRTVSQVDPSIDTQARPIGPEERPPSDTWMPGLSLSCIFALEDNYERDTVEVIKGLHYFYCMIPYDLNARKSRASNSTSVPVPAECYVFRVLGAPCALYGAMSETYGKMANTTAYKELVEKLGHAANWTEQMKDEIMEAGSKLTDSRTYNKFVEKMARLHTRARKFWENADPRDPLSKGGKAVETVKEYGRKVKKYGRKVKSSVKKSFWSGMGNLRGFFSKSSRTEE